MDVRLSGSAEGARGVERTVSVVDPLAEVSMPLHLERSGIPSCGVALIGEKVEWPVAVLSHPS